MNLHYVHVPQQTLIFKTLFSLECSSNFVVMRMINHIQHIKFFWERKCLDHYFGGLSFANSCHFLQSCGQSASQQALVSCESCATDYSGWCEGVWNYAKKMLIHLEGHSWRKTLASRSGCNQINVQFWLKCGLFPSCSTTRHFTFLVFIKCICLWCFSL